KSIRPLGFKVRGIAIEIPAVGQFTRPAEIKRLVIDVPGLAALQGDDGIDLPAFQKLALSIHRGKSVSYGECKAMANVLIAAGMVQQGTPAIHGKERHPVRRQDRKSTRLNSSHRTISYAVFCLKKKKKEKI